MQVNKLKIAIAVAIASALVVAYQFKFPSTQYFECKVGDYGSEWEETPQGKKDIKSYFSSPEYLTVKKYMYGMYYAINNYEINECEKLEDLLFCGKDENTVWLRMVDGQMSQVKKSFEKINHKSVWKCERIERLVK